MIFRARIASPVGLLALLVFLGFGIALPVHAGERHYYYTDAQGTVLAKTDAQGNIVARYDYKPYGAPMPGAQAHDGPTGYTGHVNDAETGLVYMQARYYDPVMGRFLSVDPVRPEAGNGFNFNRYAYANNNPVRYTDPDGRCILCIAALGAIIAGAIDTSIQEVRHPYQPVNKTEVAISAVAGGLTAGSASLLSGAAAGGSITVGQAVLRQAAVSGAVGGGQSAANDLADGQPVSGRHALNAAGVNIVASLAGSGVSVGTGEFNGASTSAALNGMSKSAVNAPAGIGHAIADTTKTAGNFGAAQTTSQAILSQSSSMLIDTAGNVVNEKLDEGSMGQ